MKRIQLIALVIVAAPPLAAQVNGAPVHAITLSEAIARGRSSGVQAALARLSAQTVDARRGQRAADRLPDISATASTNRQTLNLREFGLSFPGFPAVTDPFTLFRGKVSVNQLLFDKATGERLRTIKDSAIAAGLDADRAGELSAAAAGVAWLRLASAEERVHAREQDSTTAFALLEIARAQVDAGTAPRIDRTRSETQAAAVRTSLAVARNERGRAQLELARALDLPPAQSLAVSGDPAIALATIPADVDAAVALARTHRADLAAERQRDLVMRQGLAAIKSEFFPTLGAMGFVQTSGTDVNDLARTWSLGIGLSMPLFDGFRRARRSDEQRLRIDAESLRLRDLESQVDADVRQAMLDLSSAGEQLALANEQVRLAEQVLSEARERFAAGVAGSVETTNAQAELAAARDVLIQARVSIGAAQVGAAKALGLLDQVH